MATVTIDLPTKVKKPLTTDIQAKNLKPESKAYKRGAGKGLYMEVYPISEKCPKGSKKWRFQYRYNGKQKRLSLGSYPEVSLQDAIKHRDQMRKELYVEKKDPSKVRRNAKNEHAENESRTFKAITLDWHDKKNRHLSKNYKKKILRNFEYNVFREIGNKPINTVSRNCILELLRKIESRSAFEMTHRTLTKCNQVFEYALNLGIVKENPCKNLREVLVKPIQRHFHALTDIDEISVLLKRIDDYQKGTKIVQCAFKLLPLLFIRTSELRKLEWININWDKKLIHIPKEKMKMGKEHIVPLPSQAIQILNDLYLFTGSEKFIFPNANNRNTPPETVVDEDQIDRYIMSPNTILNILYDWGYKGRMTGHGFRTIACTYLQNLGFLPDIIDFQLAHENQRGKIWRAYNRADFLPERIEMMQKWADYIDELKKA